MSFEQPILLVEDNDDDAELTERAFRQAKISNPMVRVADGAEAIDYLHAKGKFATNEVKPLPAVVLLDLNLPKLAGLDVLKAIRADTTTQHLPVVVLTSSDEEADRKAAYARHANSYVRKPVDYDQFVKAARQLGLYWMALNLPPPAHS